MLDILLGHMMPFRLDMLSIVLLIFMSLSMRFILLAMGQKWIGTFSHTATLIFLPIITFVITKVISGNIALSLGMVGALSIVRFRNPVKSPFELSVYFASITMGIATSVSPKWLIFLVLSLSLALLVLAILTWVSKTVFSKPLFQASFSEGNQMSTLEVKASASIKTLHSSDFLLSETQNAEGFQYILAATKFSDLVIISDQIAELSTVSSKRLNR